MLGAYSAATARNEWAGRSAQKVATTISRTAAAHLQITLKCKLPLLPRQGSLLPQAGCDPPSTSLYTGADSLWGREGPPPAPYVHFFALTSWPPRPARRAESTSRLSTLFPFGPWHPLRAAATPAVRFASAKNGICHPGVPVDAGIPRIFGRCMSRIACAQAQHAQQAASVAEPALQFFRHNVVMSPPPTRELWHLADCFNPRKGLFIRAPAHRAQHVGRGA